MADIVVVAHAFHWFDKDECKIEFNRLLKEGGTVGLIWNFYSDAPAMQEYNHLIHYECATREALLVRDKVTADLLNDFFAEYQTFVYENKMLFDFDAVIKLSQSAHCTPVEGEQGFDFMCSKLKTWFDKYQQNGFVEFAYDCTLYKGSLSKNM